MNNSQLFLQHGFGRRARRIDVRLALLTATVLLPIQQENILAESGELFGPSSSLRGIHLAAEQ
jgi:hypothetical protein